MIAAHRIDWQACACSKCVLLRRRYPADGDQLALLPPPAAPEASGEPSMKSPLTALRAFISPASGSPIQPLDRNEEAILDELSRRRAAKAAAQASNRSAAQ